MSKKEFEVWVLRIFGSWEAYRRSLPPSRWVESAHGWYTAARSRHD